MRSWTPQQVAQAAGAQLLDVTGVGEAGPERVSIDSRESRPGTLFVGLPGERVHGGEFAAAALAAGAWGVLTDLKHAEQALSAAASRHGAVVAASDPLLALQSLATAWRRELGARVIGVTGSTGKTSTKDLLLALLAPQRRTVASRANFNTEIGLPLEILAAPSDAEVLVLEMGMRGPGQIAELARIAEPDVGVIVSIGPVHLELLGSIEAIAAAKAELIAALPLGGTAIVPADEPLLVPHLRPALRHTVSFGDGGDVRLVAEDRDHVEIDVAGHRIVLEVPFPQAHLRRNLLAAVAAAQAVGVTPSGRVELALSPGRGQRTRLPGDVLLIEDCYNANPMSMRAALVDLADTAGREPGSRRVAVLGDMLELGPDERSFHAALAVDLAAAGVELLIAVGPLAAEIADAFDGESHRVGDAAGASALVPSLLEPGDVVLVKASNGVGLGAVCQALSAGAPA
jgi:UDP-N-acetylmuramoyl-tripeptide--D-alanyl-D-alanine ligase